LGVECQPVVWAGGCFLPVEKVSHRAGVLKSLLKRLLRGIPVFGRVFYWTPVKKPLGLLYDAATSRLYHLLRWLKGDIIRFREGDVLFLLDFSWLMPLWPAVRTARKRGARVGAMIYDLVPVLFPRTCNQELLPLFRGWFDHACATSDFLVGISRTVAGECRRHLAGLGEGAGGGTKVGWFYLGADLDRQAPGGQVREEVRRVFDDPAAGPYLTVATLEPRKNHQYLLDAFDRVWLRGLDARLCLVGKQGWHCEDVVRRIREHPFYRKRLFLLSDLSDADLLFCYDRAKALIFPSIYEGFGLPIVEALSRGCKVLASDIPIHREVGGEYCAYFDLGSPDSLASLITDHHRTGRLPPTRPIEGFRWQNWEESCEKLIRVLVEPA
jgi:alpha-1,2-rhamnosyltransferase